MSVSVQTTHSSQSRSAADPVSGVQAAAVEAGRALERAREARNARNSLDAAIDALAEEHALALTDNDRTSARTIDAALRKARQARASLLGAAERASAESPAEPAAHADIGVPLGALSRQERKAISDRALAEIAGLRADWEALAAEGLSSPETGIDRPGLLRARGLLCSLGAVVAGAAEAGADGEASEAVALTVAEITEHMAEAGEPWALPGAEDGQLVPASHLQRLAGAYGTCAEAQAAWGRYMLIRGDLNGGRRLLLEPIAAAQALLNKALRLCRSSDRMQVRLYTDIEAECKREQFYIEFLSASMDDGRAAEAASQVAQALKAAEAKAAEARAAEQRRQRRSHAVEAVLRLLKAKPDLGCHESRLAADRAEILPLLQEMLDAGEPASSRLVRDALTAHEPALLEGEPAVAAVLAEVLKERERRGIGVEPEPEPEEPEPTDEEMVRMTAEVRERVEGRLLLLLGGTPRKRVCAQLKRELGCADVVWPPSTKSDSPSRHEPEVRRAEIVVLIKNFARHGTGDMARDVARETGADFLMLPSGYGVTQVIYQLHRYYSGKRCEPEE